MDFKEFKGIFQKNFYNMVKDVSIIFEVDFDKDEMWNIYLNAFPEGSNELYRERTEHDCSCCRHFLRNAAGIIVIDKNNKRKTIWDFEIDGIYKPVIDALNNYMKDKPIHSVYYNDCKKLGTDSNLEKLNDGSIIKYDHFYLELKSEFVKDFDFIPSAKGSYKTNKETFKRSLDIITIDSIETVMELINSNTLYKGFEFKNMVEQFLNYKKEYDKLQTVDEGENYVWRITKHVNEYIYNFKNKVIGTLVYNISEGMDLEEAIKEYEKYTAPSGYKRSKPIYTKQMLDDAKSKIINLGYENSLERRYATLDDITINNILFSNKDVSKKISGNIFDEMENDIPTNPKKLKRVEEITIDKFINDILPTTNNVEVLLENKHCRNMVSLIAPKNKEAKTMFKWGNNFSWAYSGNMTDSIKENVKNAGGDVQGVLRFSIQWNDTLEHDRNDLDAHCVEPWGNRIHFRDKFNRDTTGELDVDIITPEKGVPAVENITWSNKDKMGIGEYRFMVHNYSHRGGTDGFKAQIEFDGQIYDFVYNKELKQGEYVQVATVDFDGQNFKINEILKSEFSSKDIWNLKTNKFIPVNVIMHSPNYWDEQEGIGNKHYFFMLKDCINDEKPNGFYNEFLKHELYEHRRVFEALGSKMSVESNENQLSGLGFSSTMRNDLTVKVTGKVERIFKIKF